MGWTIEPTDNVSATTEDGKFKVEFGSRTGKPTETYKIKYVDGSSCGEFTVVQTGDTEPTPPQPGQYSMTLKIINNSGHDFYTNGWGKIYVKNGASHISALMKLSSNAASDYHAYCNKIKINNRGNDTFSVELSGHIAAAIAAGGVFEMEGDCPRFSFWIASIVTSNIPLSQGGQITDYSSADPLACGTLSGDSTLKNGGNYTLDITSLSYEPIYTKNDVTQAVSYYNPQASNVCE